MSNPPNLSADAPPGKPRAGFFDAFFQLFRLPLGFWVVVFAFVIESMAYFGALTLMGEFISADLRLGDAWASTIVSVFTMLVTLFMLGAGSYAESFGLRRALLAALLLCFVGRVAYGLTPGLSGGLAVVVVLSALLVVALGEAILQPVCYSGVKQYTDEQTSSMGYGVIYAFMNAGIVVVGTLSAWIRPSVQELLDTQRALTTNPAVVVPTFDPLVTALAGVSSSGINAVNWTCAGITLATLVAFAIIFQRGVERNKLRPDPAVELRELDRRTWGQRLGSYFSEGPFSNTRFIFFIFMLLPVRTLFAHQWLTMPQYILRAYPVEVANRMEWLVNWINPAIIFIGVPIATALTRKANVYTMMIIGSLVSAAPTFLLCGGPDLTMLITYFFLFSIGEALWSARFLEYASELAPPGRLAQYMGLANVPWLLAKGTTGFYSGHLLERFCPRGVPAEQLQTETLWLIYGCIAMLSPIGLLLARGWVKRGSMHASAPAANPG